MISDIAFETQINLKEDDMEDKAIKGGENSEDLLERKSEKSGMKRPIRKSGRKLTRSKRKIESMSYINARARKNDKVKSSTKGSIRGKRKFETGEEELAGGTDSPPLKLLKVAPYNHSEDNEKMKGTEHDDSMDFNSVDHSIEEGLTVDATDVFPKQEKTSDTEWDEEKDSILVESTRYSLPTEDMLKKQVDFNESLVCVICCRGFFTQNSFECHIKAKHKIGMVMYDAIQYGAIKFEDVELYTLQDAQNKLAALEVKERIKVEPKSLNEEIPKKRKVSKVKRICPEKPVICPACKKYCRTPTQVSIISFFLVQDVYLSFFYLKEWNNNLYHYDLSLPSVNVFHVNFVVMDSLEIS